MEIDSLLPEVGLELFKTASLRERYIKRIEALLTKTRGHITLSIIGNLDLLREISIQVVELIQLWEKTQVSYPNIVQYTWNGEIYLEKMQHDLDFLSNFDSICAWMGFELIQNPFLVPPEAISPTLVLSSNSYLVFGRKPDEGRSKLRSPSKPVHKFKSPYATPIINDPQVFTHLSATNQLKKKFKKSTNQESSFVDDKANAASFNPYLCYLSSELIQRLRSCLNKMVGISLPDPVIKQQPGTGGSDIAAGSSQAVEQDQEGGEYTQTPFVHQLSQSESQQSIDNSNGLLLSNESFHHSLAQQSESVYQLIDAGNEAYRLSFATTGLSMQYSQLWTPHEIHLQKQVQRRGGELYVLTAAAMKGRMKAPTRATRYQRMQTDLEHYILLHEQLSMLVEDCIASLTLNDHFYANKEEAILLLTQHIEARDDMSLRKDFARQQVKYFSMVTENGNLLDLHKQRQLHQMKDGQTRLDDQKYAMIVEDRMIRRVQTLIRRVFGRGMRKVEIARRHRAATVIQCSYRAYTCGVMIKRRAQQLRLAKMLQRLFRIKQASNLRSQLLQEALERSSALAIQRLFRGYLGRRRLAMKRKMVKSLLHARDCVTIPELTPGDVEELADYLEDYVRDVTITIPLSVLSILRGVLFLFNGSQSETVIVSTHDGYTEKKFIYAETTSWQGMKLILRRKGRFLRRLRGLVVNSCFPNPSKIIMSSECYRHLHDIREYVKEVEFDCMDRAGHCIVQLLRYLIFIIDAYDLQDLFPEYFEPGLPSWFRGLMRIREAYDRSEITRRMENATMKRLEEIKSMHANLGKKYSHISKSVARNREELITSRNHYKTMKEKLKTRILQLETQENRQNVTLQAIVRAKELAKQVADGDLKEYLRTVLIPDEGILKELQYVCDMKNIALLQAKTQLLQILELNDRNKAFRDFDNILKLKSIHEKTGRLGTIKGDLLILLEGWEALIEEIEGVQYVPDLTGEKLTRYNMIKTHVQSSLTHRTQLTQEVNIELQKQYLKVFTLITQSNLKFTNKFWDEPTHLEIEFEEMENRECCKRDYDLEFRKRRHMTTISLTSEYDFTPFLLVVDAKLPRKFLRNLEAKLLLPFHFIRYDMNHDSMSKAHAELQSLIDEQHHILLLTNRRYCSYKLSTKFDAEVEALTNVLIPHPRVILISAENCYTCSVWLETLDTSPSTHIKEGVMSREGDYDTSLGKQRKMSIQLDTFLKLRGNPSTSINSRGIAVVASFWQDWLAVCGNIMKMTNTIRNNNTKNIKTKDFWHIFTKENRLDMFIAINLCIIWNVIDVNLATWDVQQDICQAIVKFRVFLSKVEYIEIRQLFLQFPTIAQDSSSYVAYVFEVVLKRNVEFFGVLEKVMIVDYYRYPARAMIVQWIRCTYNHIISGKDSLPFPTRSSIAGGDESLSGAGRASARPERGMQQVMIVRELAAAQPSLLRSHNSKITTMSRRYHHHFTPTYEQMILMLTNPSAMNNIIGDILHHFASPLQVLETRNVHWKAYYDRECVDSLDTQSLGSKTFTNTTGKGVESVVRMYHHGEDILVELEVTTASTVNHERNTLPTETTENNPDDEQNILSKIGFHSSSTTDDGRSKEKMTCRYFSTITSQDLMTLIQPNFTEIFEGRINNSQLMSTSNADYYQTITSWITVDSIGESINASIVRTRYLVLSKLGSISGYYVRLEVYEEKFGELRLMIFGLSTDEGDDESYPDDNFSDTSDSTSSTKMKVRQLFIDRDSVYHLLTFSDEYNERDKLEAFDSAAMAYIFSNRLQILPTKGWKHFLSHGELLPMTIMQKYGLCIRKRFGPGRLVGRQLLNLQTMFIQPTNNNETATIQEQQQQQQRLENRFLVLLLIYEINSENASHEMRIVLYHLYDGQTAEYRISSLERLLLFTDADNSSGDNNTVLQQIINKLKLVYTDLSADQNRVLLSLSEAENLTVEQLKLREYEVEGDDEYEICTHAHSLSSRSSSASDSLKDDSNTLSEDDIEQVSSRCHPESHQQGWGWALYFNRTPLTELRGNLSISITLQTTLKGFQIFTYNPRTWYETYHFLSFHDAVRYLNKSSLAQLEEDISNLDESVALDLIDELFMAVDIQDSDDHGLILTLNNETSTDEINHDNSETVDDGHKSETVKNTKNVDELLIPKTASNQPPMHILAYLKEVSKALPTHPLSRKQTAQQSYRITIELIKAFDLMRNGTFTARNAVAIVRYNMREVGRTGVIRGTLNPDFTSSGSSKNVFEIFINKQSLLQTCSIDIELFDCDVTTHKVTDYLGGVKLSGPILIHLLDKSNGENVTYELQRSKKLSEQDNRSVKGNLVLKGSKKTLGVSLQSTKTATRESFIANTSEKQGELFPVQETENSSLPQYRWFYLHITHIHLIEEFLNTSTEQFLIYRVVLDDLELYKGSISLPLLDILDLPWIECRFPRLQPLALCNLKLEFWVVVNKKTVKRIGDLKLHGSRLKDFVRKNSQVLHVQSFHICNHSSESEHQEEQNEVSLGLSFGQMTPQKFVLQIKSAKNLPKADLFGKSDPFVKVFWNLRLIGQTPVIKNTLNPVWANNAEFNFFIPLHFQTETEIAKNCTLELQVFDYDQLSACDLLGVVTLTGEHLSSFLFPSQQVGVSRSYPLQPSKIVKMEVQVSGELEIIMKQMIENQVPEIISPYPKAPITLGRRAAQIQTQTQMFTQTQTQNNLDNQTHIQEDWELIQAELNSMPHLLERQLHLAHTQHFKLVLIQANNLANADTFGKSDPYTKLWFNGQYLGKTKTIDDTLNPVWNEEFVVHIARGQTLQSCLLELEVYDEDLFHEGEFLGGLLLRGNKLVDLLSSNNNTGEFELQKSATYSAKMNSLVQGSIHIKLIDVTAELAHLYSEEEGDVDGSHDENHSIAVENISSVKVAQTIELKINTCKIDISQLPLQLSQEIVNVVGIIRFNGEMWYFDRGLLYLEEGFVSWNHNQTMRFPLPLTITISDCHLEFILLCEMSEKKEESNAVFRSLELPKQIILGGFYLHGTALEQFVAISNNQAVEDNMQPNMKNITVNLSTLPFLPSLSSSTAAVIAATLELNTRLLSITTTPILKQRKFTRGTTICLQPVVLTISSALEADTEHWRHCFDNSSDHQQQYFSSTDNSLARSYKGKEVKDGGSDTSHTSSRSRRSNKNNQQQALQALATTASGANSPNPLLSIQNRRYKRRKSTTNPHNKQQLLAMSAAAAGGVDETASIASSDHNKKAGSKQQQALVTPVDVKPPLMRKVSALTTDNQPQQPQAVVDSTPTQLLKQSRKLELPAMNFTITVKSTLEDEHRIYWRGKVTPKEQLFTSEQARRAVFASRASRLIRTKSLADLDVVSEVHYLREVGEDIVIESTDLPVCVREMVSSGAGLVTREFRMELLTNTGLILGVAAMKDEEYDWQQVIGYNHVSHLLPSTYLQGMVSRTSREGWDWVKIFEHIATNRMSIDLLSSAHGAPVKKKDAVDDANHQGHGGRRAGLFRALSSAYTGAATSTAETADTPAQEHDNSHSHHHGSVISLQRDPPKVEILHIVNEERAEDEEEKVGHEEEQLQPEQLPTPPPELQQQHDQETVMLRIHSTTHRLTGHSFRCIVLLAGPFPLLASNPDAHFRQYPDLAASLQPLTILFRCKDSADRRHYELNVSGHETALWLPANFGWPDLITKFRRGKFGVLLLSYLGLKFTAGGSIRLQFLSPSAQQLSHEELLADLEVQPMTRQPFSRRGSRLRSASSDHEGSDYGSGLASRGGGGMGSKSGSQRFIINRQTSRRMSRGKSRTFLGSEV